MNEETRPLQSSGSRIGASHLRVIRRASALITELGADLDSRLSEERVPSERMRLLRETTNRITRAANDAVHAYQSASRTVKNELQRPKGKTDAAHELDRELRVARAELLAVLDAASRRYPPRDPKATRPSSADATAGAR